MIFKRIVSLARKRSKNLPQETKYLQENLPNYAAIIPEDGGMLGKISDIFHNEKRPYDKYVLEIGFGSGENILFNAINNPDYAYIGCEVFKAGAIKLLKDIKENNVNNIRIWNDDALELIMRLPNDSLDLVYILHPDPWPKRKHHNRRLINVDFLKLIASKMKNNAEILMITDHQDYARSIAKTILEVMDLFSQKNSDYPPITKTKYRLKADSLGHESKYFYLVRIGINQNKLFTK
ncbi:MAG: tRNA (guanosine(46)-N7)-methyltransferase TrmB [Pseudomonadota bacterium]